MCKSCLFVCSFGWQLATGQQHEPNSLDRREARFQSPGLLAVHVFVSILYMYMYERSVNRVQPTIDRSDPFSFPSSLSPFSHVKSLPPLVCSNHFALSRSLRHRSPPRDVQGFYAMTWLISDCFLPAQPIRFPASPLLFLSLDFHLRYQLVPHAVRVFPVIPINQPRQQVLALADVEVGEPRTPVRHELGAHARHAQAAAHRQVLEVAQVQADALQCLVRHRRPAEREREALQLRTAQ